MKTKIINLTFLAVCATMVFYITMIAENRYDSVARFTVVVEDTSNIDAANGVMSLLSKGTGANTDTDAVIGFIHSSDMLKEIEDEFDLVQHYSSPKNDIVYKLGSDALFEERLRYYRKTIEAKHNKATGLIDLTVQTFEPELSLAISKFILSKTEVFINELNQKVAAERLDFVRRELKRTQKNVTEKKDALLAFQNTNKIIDPVTIIEAQLQGIQQMKLDMIKMELELTMLKTSSPNSSNIKAREAAIEELGRIIKKEEARATGEDSEKMSQILAEYVELKLNLDFALQLRGGSEILMEKIRSESISRSRFFSVIQNPYMPEHSMHPRRLYLCGTLLAVLFLSYYVIKSLIASIFDRVK